VFNRRCSSAVRICSKRQRLEGMVRAPDGAVLPSVTLQIFGTKLTTIRSAEGRYPISAATDWTTENRLAGGQQL